MAKSADSEIAARAQGMIPRDEVPKLFPCFRNAQALAHLAHEERGPLYVTIGGRSWYDPADIVAWIEAGKRTGPGKPRKKPAETPKPQDDGPRKRGRPTKFEQMQRQRAFTFS